MRCRDSRCTHRCGHCKKLEPEWKKAAGELKGRAKLGAVDATVHGDLAARYGVKGYPTIKEFVGGKVRDYEGGRTAGDIVTHAENRLLATAKPHKVGQTCPFR